jgi:hypothetical protein
MQSKAQLIAPCGMNCGICHAYLRDKNTCPDCRLMDSVTSSVNCTIKNCDKLKSSSSQFCYECKTYPCKRLKQLDKRYRTKYAMSMLENLESIRSIGLNAFVENEGKRWRCERCGGVICVHKGYCLKCGPAKRPLLPEESKGASKAESLQQYMDEYKKQMEKGSIRKAYQGLMEYIADLRTHFKNKYPEYSVPGNMYNGFLDMTYFPLFPQELKQRSLKIAVVFLHETCSFEVWLSGNNREVQAEYLELFQKSRWKKYPLAAAAKGVDYIIRKPLDGNPDFSDTDALTAQIEKETLAFIKDIEDFLAGDKHSTA